MVVTQRGKACGKRVGRCPARVILKHGAVTTMGALAVPDGHAHDPNRHDATLECVECHETVQFSYHLPCPATGCAYNQETA